MCLMDNSYLIHGEYTYNYNSGVYIKFMETKTTKVWVRFMVLNATFNNILVISWRSVLLVRGGNP
jgi:hypothetical protein